jgi:hypothetical protein
MAKKDKVKGHGVIAIEGGFDLVAQPERKVNISEITIVRIVWIPEEKVIRARVKEKAGQIELWAGDAYDALNGVVSMDNIRARVMELLGVPA